VALTAVLTFKPVDKDPKAKANDQYSPVVLFIILYNVVLTFKSVDKNTLEG